MTVTVLILAWGIEAAFGWPEALYRKVRHPVVWIGWLVNGFERVLNGEGRSDVWRRLAGAISAAVVILLTWALAAALVALLPEGSLGFVLQALVASSFLASRSLYSHVAAVAEALSVKSIDAARTAVSHIVGRDPQSLDEAGITRAALESLAENASDGVVAPLFWGVLLGLPGLAAYKALNTLDSMIGHRNSRFEDFGKASARLDDVANWIPARLTAALLLLAGPPRGRTLLVLRRDARRHRSPNAGWPEAAMAGALNVRLSGPRCYGDRSTEEPWLNADAPDPGPHSLELGLALYLRALVLLAFGLLVVAIAPWLLDAQVPW
ncbi:MAG: adenosylcobinamide-phosphate synthase CbiB [Pseudomonadota bacterium]